MPGYTSCGAQSSLNAHCNVAALLSQYNSRLHVQYAPMRCLAQPVQLKATCTICTNEVFGSLSQPVQLKATCTICTNEVFGSASTAQGYMYDMHQ